VSRTLLAGDVGGTKTTLALYDAEDVRAPRVVRTYDSRTVERFDSLVEVFLGDCDTPEPAVASFAVAGPIVEHSVRITNLSWGLSGPDLTSRFHFKRVSLVNDVEALAWAVPTLRPEEVDVLLKGQADPTGPIGVLALGTGLGESYVTGGREAPRAHPSEGGHADFAPTTPQQARLLESLWREHKHASVERACSGIGLPKLYRFLVSEEGWAEDPAVAAEIAAAADPTPVVVQAALEGRSAVCHEAVALLCDILAAEASNLALKLLSTGGIFLGGGIPPRVLPFLRAPRFRNAFLAKGRFSLFLERVPVLVVLPPQAVLWGAALRGRLCEGDGTPESRRDLTGTRRLVYVEPAMSGTEGETR
jgi:glucokinase